MVMMFLGEPVWLILAYGVLGAFFMPFLAVTLLWLLNTDRTPAEWRNQIFSNVALVLCTLAFAALAFNEARKAIARSEASGAGAVLVEERQRCVRDLAPVAVDHQ